MESEPAKTFRGLPLSAEQDSEIRHYIHVRCRAGQQWDTIELRAMLADMLDPPETDDEGSQSIFDDMRTERRVAAAEESETGDAAASSAP